MDRLFEIASPKPSASEGFVDIGLTKWLGDEEISSVAFTAQNFETKQVETSVVIDTSKCTNTTTIIKPFIQAGTHGETYLVKMVVTTNGNPATIETFYLKFKVDDNIPKQPNYFS